MRIIKNICTFSLVVALMSSLSLMTGCSESEPAEPTTSLSVSGGPIYYMARERILQVKAVGDWKLSILYVEGEDWCTINPDKGTGNATVVSLKFTANDGDSPRSAIVILENNGIKYELTITQYDVSYGDGSIIPDTDPGGSSITVVDKLKGNPQWKELPATRKFGNAAVVSHSFTMPNKTTARNFTMLYDTVKRMAYWVAYPLSKEYRGSIDRTNRWAYDPKIPKLYQPNLTKGFPTKDDLYPTHNYYDRGHQMPSADRTITELANQQTFFFTNMTAQYWYFNQQLWGNLEDKVRTYAGASDTLYVVTGAVLGNPVTYTVDISGQQVAVPKYYYKVLLALNGSSYKSVGFWMENKRYDNNTVTAAYAKTVQQIEELTSMEFFPLVDPSVKTTWDPAYWKF